LNLLIPAWCEKGASLELNGKRLDMPIEPGAFARIHRTWKLGDQVRISLPMPVRKIESHPLVTENVNRNAITRGPMVYCIEAADHSGADVRYVNVARDARWTSKWNADLLNGVVVLSTRGSIEMPDPEWSTHLYRTSEERSHPARREIDVTAIPYCMWANRTAGPMRVWL
jgi:DUF1680 family protein